MYGEDLWFEEPGDELDDDEYPEEDDFRDEPTSTLPCPDCGTELDEDAVMCPIFRPGLGSVRGLRRRTRFRSRVDAL